MPLKKVTQTLHEDINFLRERNAFYTGFETPESEDLFDKTDEELVRIRARLTTVVRGARNAWLLGHRESTGDTVCTRCARNGGPLGLPLSKASAIDSGFSHEH